VDATFVGHPLAGVQPPSISREQYAVQYGLDPNKQWITLMPGSRRKEVRMNLPTMLEAAVGLGATYEFLLPVAPTLDAAFLKSLTGAAKVHFVLEALPALFHSRGGIIASGTATVEAAIMGTPFVMVYRVSPLTYALGRPQVKVPYFAMVNLIAGEQAVPELVQDRFTAENVVRELNQVLADGPQRTRMIEQLAEVKEKMRSGDGGASPPDRAAEIIVRLLG
jgi:lipid-A-disaccharide synthase